MNNTLSLREIYPSRDQLISSFASISLPDDDSFLKIKETLTRMGVPSDQTKTLWQSCHILHKRGSYYIVHFKELFALDGKESYMDDEDYMRRDGIVLSLEKWGLCTILNRSNIKKPTRANYTIIRFEDRRNWNLRNKYDIGVRK